MSTQSPEDTQNLASQGSVVAAGTGLSRISGFVRDVIFSNLLGASAVADAFFVAFRIPNFFRRLFAEGAFNQAFVPVLARFKTQSKAELREFLAIIVGNLGLAVVLVAALGTLAAPGLVTVFAPGFWDDPFRFDLTTQLVRVMFCYLAFITLTALGGAILNSHNRFAVPAVTPIILNVCLITAATVFVGYFHQPVMALAWGVVIAGVLQLAFQVPWLAKLELITTPKVSLSHPGARQVGSLLVPAVLASSVSQINSLIDTILASQLITGSISWLYYSDRLLELPVGLIAVALGTVLLPTLSRLATASRTDAFSETIDWGIRNGIVFGVPAAAALYFLSEPLIASIFFHGALTAHDVVMAGLSLRMFALGVVAFLLVKVLAPAFFAHQDTRTPFVYGAIAVAINVILNLALYRWFGHVGLAFATSVAAWIQAMLLLSGVRAKGFYQPTKKTLLTGLRVSVAVLGMTLILLYMVPALEFWLSASVLQRSLQLAMLVAVGGASYFLILFTLGFRLAEFRQRV